MKNSELALGKIRKWALNIAFGIVRSVVNKVKNKTAKALIEMSIEPLEDIINLVTDKEPDNGQQLLDLFKDKGDDYAIKALKAVRELVLIASKMNPILKSLLLDGLDAILSEIEEEAKKDVPSIGKNWGVK